MAGLWVEINRTVRRMIGPTEVGQGQPCTLPGWNFVGTDGQYQRLAHKIKGFYNAKLDAIGPGAEKAFGILIAHFAAFVDAQDRRDAAFHARLTLMEVKLAKREKGGRPSTEERMEEEAAADLVRAYLREQSDWAPEADTDLGRVLDARNRIVREKAPARAAEPVPEDKPVESEE